MTQFLENFHSLVSQKFLSLFFLLFIITLVREKNMLSKIYLTVHQARIGQPFFLRSRILFNREPEMLSKKWRKIIEFFKDSLGTIILQFLWNRWSQCSKEAFNFFQNILESEYLQYELSKKSQTPSHWWRDAELLQLTEPLCL